MLLRLALPLALALLFVACADNGGQVTPTSTPGADSTTVADGTCLPGESAPVVAACEDLVAQLDAAPGAVEVVSVTPMEWPDVCLGAPEPNELCAQMITPGYQVALKLASIARTYTYHTDETSNVRLAGISLGLSEPVQVQLGRPERVVLAEEPVVFDFAPDGRLFFTERRLGEIWTVDLAAFGSPGTANFEKLFAEVDIFFASECGLLGIAIDPEFSTNHYLYVYVTQPVAGREDVGKPRVIRFTDVDGKGTDPTVLIDNLPLTNATDCLHVGGNIHFGPDGYMYVSLGNFERPQIAADLGNPMGKILRLDKSDGSAAPGNPFAGDPSADERVFAYGFRNPWDFAFHPGTGKIYAADNGPGNCDELNLIEAGADYGAPGSIVSGDAPSCFGLGGVDPIYVFAFPGRRPEQSPSNVAPTGVAFVSGDTYPSLGDGLIVCEFMTKSLRHLQLTGAEQDEVADTTVVSNDCQFSVRTDADGLIYYSNAGGIYRLPPAESP